MPRRFIDISVALETGIKSDPEFMLPKIKYQAHEETARTSVPCFPALPPTSCLTEWAGRSRKSN